MRGATIDIYKKPANAKISTHAPLAGRDKPTSVSKRQTRTFQPTRPLRGATYDPSPFFWFYYISTHAPLAGRDGRARWYTIPKSVFQPTRPLRGATPTVVSFLRRKVFQPTRPLRGATCSSVPSLCPRYISTHAPLAGRDMFTLIRIISLCHFNPRAPCGARLLVKLRFSANGRFQPTRPLRGAISRAPCGARLIALPVRCVLPIFQPTRPLRGATRARHAHRASESDFNPRAPCGARQEAASYYRRFCAISTHAPLAGRDRPPR